MLQQPLPRPRPNAGNVIQFAHAVAHLAAFAVVAHRKAVALITDLLDYMQHRRAPVEHHRIVLLSMHVDDLLALGNRGQRLRRQPDLLQRGGGGVQLPQSAVDQHQRRQRLLVLLQPLVASLHNLAHRGEVVHAADRLHLELAVVSLLHRALFPDDHGGNGLRALDVRDVEALNALWWLGQQQSILQRRLHRRDARLQDSEALVVRLLRVGADQVNQRALLPALRSSDLNLVPAALAQSVGQQLAVGKVDGHIDTARHIALIQIELFQQRREECCRREGSLSFCIVILNGAKDLLFACCAKSLGLSRPFLHGHSAVLMNLRCGFIWSGLQLRFALGLLGRDRVHKLHAAQILPEHLAPVHDLSRAHVKQVHGQHLVLIVEAEDIGIAIVGGGDALPVLRLAHGDELIAQPRCQLKLHGLCRSLHARGQPRL